jgi:hypothetical protein
VLANQALDFQNPLSPFSTASTPTRERAIAIMQRAVAGSDLRVHPDLEPRLPVLLWLLQMAVLFLWVHDPSEGQARTRRVSHLAQALVHRLLALTALPRPGLTSMVEQVGALIDEITALHDA